MLTTSKSPLAYSLSCILITVLFTIGCSKTSSNATGGSNSLSVSDVKHTRDSVSTKLQFVVKLAATSTQEVSVDYTTVEGTAKVKVDFMPVSGTLKIAPNASQGIIEVEIIGRKLPSSSQSFNLKLSNPVNAILKTDNAIAFIQNPGFGYQLVWQDEFDSTALNSNYWNYETGGGGWGNNELQNYTAGTGNAYVNNGNLVIEAKEERLGGNLYTSARLTTKGKVKFTYGKMEIRAKVPTTKGIWPALWMLGENIEEVNWPSCGEIDVMELINKEQPSKVYGTAHWGASVAAHQSSGGSSTLGTGFFSDDFHVYSIEWDLSKIDWYVDGVKFHTVTSQQVTSGSYPFNKDFFIILNVAVGGQWPGSPDNTSVFPQKMLVDYVRVYQK